MNMGFKKDIGRPADQRVIEVGLIVFGALCASNILENKVNKALVVRELRWLDTIKDVFSLKRNFFFKKRVIEDRVLPFSFMLTLDWNDPKCRIGLCFKRIESRWLVSYCLVTNYNKVALISFSEDERNLPIGPFISLDPKDTLPEALFKVLGLQVTYSFSF